MMIKATIDIKNRVTKAAAIRRVIK